MPVICSRIVVYFQHIYPSHAEARCFCAGGKWKDARRVTPVSYTHLAAEFMCRQNEKSPSWVTREPENVLAIAATANEKAVGMKKDGVLAGYLLTLSLIHI